MKWLILFIGVATAVPAHAMTLKQLIEIADQQNIDRRITMERRTRAAAEFRQAWTGLLPSLVGQALWTNNEYAAVVQLPGSPLITITPYNQFDGIATFQLPLIDTSTWFRSAALGDAEDAAEYRDQQTRDSVRRQVASTYYAYAAALALRDSALRSLAFASAQQTLQEIRNEAGAATELELLRAKAETEHNKQTVADTEALISNTRRSLRTLTGVELDDKATLPTDNLSTEGELGDLEGRLGFLPAVLAAQKDADVANQLALVSKLALVPTVTANFVGRLTNAASFVGHSKYYTAGIGLTWRLDGPTFSNTGIQGSAARAANLSVERQQLISRDQVHSDWETLRTAIEKVTAAEAQVKSARRAASVAKDRYSAGAATQIDVIQAERDLFAAEVSQVQARTDLASSHVALRISSGLPLQFD